MIGEVGHRFRHVGMVLAAAAMVGSAGLALHRADEAFDRLDRFEADACRRGQTNRAMLLFYMQRHGMTADDGAEAERLGFRPVLCPGDPGYQD